MTLHLGDCLDVLPTLPDASVDMVFADLPYGVTANKWDVVIPFEPLWAQLLRVSKLRCAFLFTATQPFATSLICSQRKLFRYDLIWEKTRATGYLHSKTRPLRCHESVVLFSRGAHTYNPQKTVGHRPYDFGILSGGKRNLATINGLQGAHLRSDGSRHPRSVFVIKNPPCENEHPTQKPVALLEWLVKTYSNPGDLVLDPTMGSGTSGVACVNTGRRFIGIEKDAAYLAIAAKRIDEACNAPRQGALAL